MRNIANKFSARRFAYVVVVIFLVLAVFSIGFVVGSSDADKPDDALAPSVSNDFRVKFSNLGLQEGIFVVQAATEADANKSNASKIAAQAAAKEIAQTFGTAYGNANAIQAEKIWNSYIDGTIAYANAARAGDEAAKQQALTKIDDEFTKEFAYFLNQTTGMEEATIKMNLSEYAKTTTRTVDLGVAGSYEEQALELEQISVVSQGLFGSIADALVAKNPDAYKE